MIIRGVNTRGEVVESDVAVVSAAELLAAKVARKVRKPKVPLAGLDFLSRLTDAEYSAIINAAAAMLQAGDPKLSRWIDMLRVNGSIRLDGADAVAAKTALVDGGLLTKERADVIFAPAV